jgi:hypothetical protein
MKHPSTVGSLGWLLCFGSSVGVLAQGPSIPVRPVGPFEAISTMTTEPTVRARVLNDGSVIVSPFLAGSRVLLLDSTLAHAVIIADSGMLTPGRVVPPVVAIPYIGDSTLLGDPNAGVLLLLDPKGTKVRTVAPPRGGTDASIITGNRLSSAIVDEHGRLLYRSVFPLDRPRISATEPWSPPIFADSFPLLRVDFHTRTAETLAVVHMPTGSRSMQTHYPDGRPFTIRNIIQPLPTTDDWAVLSDGTVAVVRGADYHVDWIRPDGRRESTSPMPFAWRRITDDDKVAIVDSLNRLIGPADSAAKAAHLIPSATKSEVVPANELPDHFPPIRQGSAMADRDANLWVLPATSSHGAGGLVYDVIQRDGRIAERVQLPPNCALAGFASGSILFLTCRDSLGGFRLTRTRVIRREQGK